jgi:transcriptional regulator with XRE-family HTH domain
MEKLKRLREASGLSQVKLAARADLNPATVNQIERGMRDASPGTLRKLADALGVSLYELMEEEAPKKAQAPSPLELEKQRGASEQPEDDGFLYNQYEAFGLLLASYWRDELEKWDEEIPPGEVPSLFVFGRLFEWGVGIVSTKTLYEERAKDGHDTQRTEFQNTLRLMEEASQAAGRKFIRVYEPVKTWKEFQKIVKENDLEAILSSVQGDE